MENLLFLGVPILKHIRVLKVMHISIVHKFQDGPLKNIASDFVWQCSVEFSTLLHSERPKLYSECNRVKSLTCFFWMPDFTMPETQTKLGESTCISAGIDSNAFCITRQPYICSANGNT